jgi:hypothetical protein
VHRARLNRCYNQHQKGNRQNKTAFIRASQHPDFLYYHHAPNAGNTNTNGIRPIARRLLGVISLTASAVGNNMTTSYDQAELSLRQIVRREHTD